MTKINFDAPTMWYKAGGYNDRVTPVMVDRATEACVWIDGRRTYRRSAYENYFERYDDARNFLLNKHEELVARMANNLQMAEKRLEIIRLTPTGAEVERAKENERNFPMVKT